MRGREGDTCMAPLRVCYNRIRPHMGLGGGTAPGMAAGMPGRAGPGGPS